MINRDPLPDFSSDMMSLIGKPTDLRPFVCDGSPIECEVFLVGINPASEMSGDFWDFWSDSRGFDKQAWFETYKTERRKRPLKLGKKKRNEISNTRRTIEWIIEEVHPMKCLETNIYAKATEQVLDLEERDRITAPLDYLLERIAPKLVIAHGKETAEYLKAQNLECTLMCVPHFSRGWSKAKAWELGSSIRKACLE